MRSAGMVPHSTPLRGAVEVAPAREVMRIRCPVAVLRTSKIMHR
jgi:hypothetical protein